MTDAVTKIASRVRGLAAETRFSQQRIADTLSISRNSVVQRINGRVPFTAAEILTLAVAMRVPTSRFFPDVEAVVRGERVA